MADHPARREHDPAGDERRWASPVPAEYGSLSRPVVDPTTPRARPSRGGGYGSGVRKRLARSPVEGDSEPAPDWDQLGLAPAAGPARRSPPAPRRAPEPAGWPEAAPPAAEGDGATQATVATPEVGPAPALVPPAPLGWEDVAAPMGQHQAPGRDPTPRGRPAIAPNRTPSSPARPRRRSSSRGTVRRVGVWSVAKVSLAFYLILLVAFVVASVLLWYLADAFGAVTSIEKSARTLFSLKSLSLHPSQVALYTGLGGALVSVVGTILNILGALIYNLISDLIGGIRVEVVDPER